MSCPLSALICYYNFVVLVAPYAHSERRRASLHSKCLSAGVTSLTALIRARIYFTEFRNFDSDFTSRAKIEATLRIESFGEETRREGKHHFVTPSILIPLMEHIKTCISEGFVKSWSRRMNCVTWVASIGEHMLSTIVRAETMPIENFGISRTST